MSNTNMTSLIKKLQELDMCLKCQHIEDVGYGYALRGAIISTDSFMEVEVLKSLGDLHLQKGKVSKDSTEFDKAAALYATARRRCTDADMEQTLEHRIGYMEKLSRRLLRIQGYTPKYPSPDYWGTADSNVSRVAEICDKLDGTVATPWYSVEESYLQTLVKAIGNSDIFLELEVLKSLGDLYLRKGMDTSDVSQFSNATAMYNKALTGCKDPETTSTLQHRIRYTDRIRDTVKKKPSTKKPRPGESSLHMGHHSGNLPRTDITKDHYLHSNITRKARGTGATSDGVGTTGGKYRDWCYEDHLKEGESCFTRADLDSAEQHFATALKMVHVRESSAQQYQREVEPLCKLGDVYSKRGQQMGDAGDLVKAAALYMAAKARSKEKVFNGKIAAAIREAEVLFLKCILNVQGVAQDNTEKHNKQLKEMRDRIKLEMETIDQRLDPYVHDEDDPCVPEIEAKRAQAVRQLFAKIAQQRKKFIGLLLDECIGLMGPPPCKYALIGLGSQSKGLVTPYSDMEFAILVEEESKKSIVYFRTLTHYLHLKVVNLGETILPALGIKSLNDFYSKSPLDNWYYDSVTQRGFSFDGSMPKASKTPLGRPGNMNNPPSELIRTPENMALKLQQDATLFLKEGYHLASILSNPCLLAGDQDLVDIYMDNTVKLLQADGGKMARQLAQEIQKENIKRINDEETITARLIDVKKDLYRFPALAVECLALFSRIIPKTIWETIEEMKNQKVISPNDAHHLTVLTSISAELRLRTYLANGGQKENLSVLTSMETAMHRQGSSLQELSLRTNNELETSSLVQVFYLPNDKQLFRYYYTAIPLKRALQEQIEKKPVFWFISDLYDNSQTVRGMMYDELCRYGQAISCYHEALKKADGTGTEKGRLLNDIGAAYGETGDYTNCVSYHEQALQLYRGIYGQNTAHHDIANSLNNVGSAWDSLCEYTKAIDYHEQALQMDRIIYGQSTANPHIATLLNNLGLAWHHVGDYRKASYFYEQALQMNRDIYGPSTAHINIAFTLDNIGSARSDLGDYSESISYYELALQMKRSMYGQGTAHPDIVLSLNNLGSALSHLGDYRTSISYHEQALQMWRGIYGQGKAHPYVATLLGNLGLAWSDLGNYKEAVSLHEQALEMRKSIHAQSTAHADIANSLHNLGYAWSQLGDYTKAITYQEQALQIYTSIYGKDKAYPEIAASLTNLGSAWLHLGDYRKSISYHEQALLMERSILGKRTTHPHIAILLGNMGLAWGHLGDYRKAVSYHEQALQMNRSVYMQTRAHPHIATSLNNLGEALRNLGDYRKAISYDEQALQMNKIIYRESPVHPHIASSLNNLGVNWEKLRDFRKAISYHEQALQMRMSIFSHSTAHPDIANSLYNLGSAWYSVNDFRKAMSYSEQALQMYKCIYGLDTPHPDIVRSLNSLGLNCYYLRNYRRALGLLHDALAMAKEVFAHDENHPMIKSIESFIVQLFNH